MTISLDKYNFSEADRSLFVESINDILRALSTEHTLDFPKKLASLLVFNGFLMWRFFTCMDADLPVAKTMGLSCDISSLALRIVQEHGLEKLKAYLEGFNDYIARQV